MPTLFTIGYEHSTPQAVLVRTQGRRGPDFARHPRGGGFAQAGFLQAPLAASLDEAGIVYLHLQKLGTPAEGRQRRGAGDLESRCGEFTPST